MKIKYVVILAFISVCFLENAAAQYVPKDKRKGETKKETTTQTTTQKTTEPKKETSDKTKKQKQKQKKSKPSELSEQSFWQRLTFGGNTGFSFGNPTLVDIAPLIGYRFSEKFNAGVGGNYLYFRSNDNFARVNGVPVNFGRVEGSYYGVRSYGQYFLVPQAFIWTEVEGMNVEFFNTDTRSVDREWQLAPLIGGGFFQEIGSGGSGFSATILYNLNHQDNISWRGTPWVTRVGFNF